MVLKFNLVLYPTRAHLHLFFLGGLHVYKYQSVSLFVCPGKTSTSLVRLALNLVYMFTLLCKLYHMVDFLYTLYCMSFARLNFVFLNCLCPQLLLHRSTDLSQTWLFMICRCAPDTRFFFKILNFDRIFALTLAFFCMYDTQDCVLNSSYTVQPICHKFGILDVHLI